MIWEEREQKVVEKVGETETCTIRLYSTATASQKAYTILHRAQYMQSVSTSTIFKFNWPVEARMSRIGKMQLYASVVQWEYFSNMSQSGDSLCVESFVESNATWNISNNSSRVPEFFKCYAYKTQKRERKHSSYCSVQSSCLLQFTTLEYLLTLHLQVYKSLQYNATARRRVREYASGAVRSGAGAATRRRTWRRPRAEGARTRARARAPLSRALRKGRRAQDRVRRARASRYAFPLFYSSHLVS